MLFFPGAGFALRPSLTIELTSNGPSPAELDTKAGYGSIGFSNSDDTTHSIAFDNGFCSGDVAPNSRLDCGYLHYVGDYTYTVDGSTEAHVVVQPVGRSVSIMGSSHSVRRGRWVTLRGRLQEENANWSPPGPGEPQPILIVTVVHTHGVHALHRVAVVHATLDRRRTSKAPYGRLLWHLRFRPKATAVYYAEALYQPSGGRVWERAASKPFGVRVHR
jgi:hypothetical protein